ncbi:hypothetical protein IAQ61_009104 [Plenodomus lingam]|uniref:uncharacterized protein n=1 Tax=Leptosphaeria maculans TaxID=5022 RepID=UPI00331791AB|nr:hypothetical protein IAQ61_009104 [Plenodomus lingam]
MPLVKLPPQGPSSNDSHASKRWQTQNRRRTLQTISELTVTDGPPPDFVSFLAAKRGEEIAKMARKANKASNKRQSLPQPYCTSPTCVQTQTTMTTPSLRSSTSHHSFRAHGPGTPDSSRYEAGWNARRERARAQQAQDFVNMNDVHITSRPHQSQPSPTTHRLPIRSSQGTPISYTTHHHQHQPQHLLLRNSRSITGFIPPTETDTPTRHSTDSTSFQSTPSNPIRRSRSGSSSSHSFTSSQTTPPLPPISPAPLPPYYTTTPSHPSRPPSYQRSTSLPSIRIERPRSAPYDHLPAPRIATLPRAQKRDFDVKRARQESLAALTAAAAWDRGSVGPGRYQGAWEQHCAYVDDGVRQRSGGVGVTARARPRAVHARSSPGGGSGGSVVYMPHTGMPPLPPSLPSALQSHSHPNTAPAPAQRHSSRTHRLDRVRRANEMERERERELRRSQLLATIDSLRVADANPNPNPTPNHTHTHTTGPKTAQKRDSVVFKDAKTPGVLFKEDGGLFVEKGRQGEDAGVGGGREEGGEAGCLGGWKKGLRGVFGGV